jgi:hypothetical protein
MTPRLSGLDSMVAAHNGSFALGVSPSNTSFAPSQSLSAMPPMGSGAGSFARVDTFSNTFQGTIQRQMRTEHGAYSQSIWIAAEGSAAERHTALGNIQALLQKQSLMEGEGRPLERATADALCDIIALRCADTNNRVQYAALELVPVLTAAVSSDAVDSLSSRFVSCITSALSSSYTAVHASALAALRAIIRRSSDANLRSLCPTLCMTCATVRNSNAKVALLGALGDVIERNHSAGDSNSKLSASDLDFCVDTCVRSWVGDAREDVVRAHRELLCCIYEYGFGFGDLGPILGCAKLEGNAAQQAAVRGVLEAHRGGVLEQDR